MAGHSWMSILFRKEEVAEMYFMTRMPDKPERVFGIDREQIASVSFYNLLLERKQAL